MRTVTPSSLLFVVALLLCTTGTAQAQWVIRNAPELGGGSLRAVAEFSCDSSNAAIAGTTQGLYLDLTNLILPGQWLDIGTGLNAAKVDIRDIVTTDSLVFCSLYGEGVWMGVVSPENNPPCRPARWQRLETGLDRWVVNDLLLIDTVLYAGTNEGVFALALERDSLGLDSNTAEWVWRRVDEDFNKEIFCLGNYRGTLMAGTFLYGLWGYPLRADSAGSPVRWYHASAGGDIADVSVYSLAPVQFQGERPLPGTTEFIPAQGMVASVGNNSALWFAPDIGPKSAPPSLAFWVDVSPSLQVPSRNQKINTILAGSWQSATDIIVVGLEYGGVLYSSNLGQSWNALNDGLGGVSLAGADVRTLTVLADSVLLAGANGAGVFKGGTLALSSVGSLFTTTDVRHETVEYTYGISTDGSSVRLETASELRNVRIDLVSPMGAVYPLESYSRVQPGTTSLPLRAAIPSGLWFIRVIHDGGSFASPAAILR